MRRVKPLDKIVAQRLKEARLSAGISQTELGNAINVSFQQIQKYENAANRISASTLWGICRVLKVPVAYFFPDEQAEDADTVAESLKRLRKLEKLFTRMRCLMDSVE